MIVSTDKLKMDTGDLHGKIFSENELYELLLFELEANFSHYYGQNLHIYFDRLKNYKIKVIEVRYFENNEECQKCARATIEKKEWFEISVVGKHIDLVLNRLDRTGLLSAIFHDHSRTETWKRGWADELPDHGPMSEAEIREAFRELAGMIEEPQYLQDSRLKKEV
jgi:hypothetical protein